MVARVARCSSKTSCEPLYRKTESGCPTSGGGTMITPSRYPRPCSSAQLTAVRASFGVPELRLTSVWPARASPAGSKTSYSVS